MGRRPLKETLFISTVRVVTVAALLLLIPVGPLAQEPPDTTATGANTESAPTPIPYVLSFSGSPLLMEVGVPDPASLVQEVRIESEVSSQRYRIAPDTPREPIILRVSPFLGSGTYDLTVTLMLRDGRTGRSELDVGFVDFVWGRDNLSFGNNSKYESVIGTFGEVLESWLNDRFGEISQSDLVLLVDYMYGLFGSNTGRCYAFAGTEVRYWRWPELLPSYYDSAHDLRGTVARYQREMNFLQFDIVFNHFLAGPGAAQIARPMKRDELAAQVRAIAGSIEADEPVAVGFAGPDLHHSMLVFGYISNPTLGTVDLLVANNWKSDEKLNIHSRDAEIIRIHLDEEWEGQRVEWRYEDGLRDRVIDRLFAVDVRRDEYAHDRSFLDGLVAELRRNLRQDHRAIVVVEEAAWARLMSDGSATGRRGCRRFDDLQEVWFERIGRTYRFAYPADLAVELEIGDDAGARVLAVVPNRDEGELAFVRTTEPPAEEETVTRRISLQPES